MVDQGKQSIISANIESGKIHTLSSGSIYVKIIVFIMDFLILNGIIWLAFVFFRDLVPPYIDKATRVPLLVMNFTILLPHHHQSSFAEVEGYAGQRALSGSASGLFHGIDASFLSWQYQQRQSVQVCGHLWSR